MQVQSSSSLPPSVETSFQLLGRVTGRYSLAGSLTRIDYRDPVTLNPYLLGFWVAAHQGYPELNQLTDMTYRWRRIDGAA